ncbi:prephenate dehydratase [Bowmanella denitrificans]|uniref:prephenate dehydratase n=2 Tax=Bowmanella denitrificans TaxID=366582 RepID=A0ABP3HFW7_9ALTE
MTAVEDGRAQLAMIPIENSTAGRVADIHHLLPESSLYIVGEHFESINHCLLAIPGATESDIKVVRSHVQALSQCRQMIKHLKITPENYFDTASSARHIAELNDKSVAAIASSLAAEEYGLKVLRANIQDKGGNTTRFVLLAKRPINPDMLDGPVMTTFTFEVTNKPAGLFKALGGFATEGVNMTKLESYQAGESFTATMFYADIEGHEGMASVARAMEELRYHTKRVRVFGTYPQERPRTLG